MEDTNKTFYASGLRRKEIPAETGKFGLGVPNEAGQRLTSFAKRTRWS